jgi:hypothetical protein
MKYVTDFRLYFGAARTAAGTPQAGYHYIVLRRVKSRKIGAKRRLLAGNPAVSKRFSICFWREIGRRWPPYQRQ